MAELFEDSLINTYFNKNDSITIKNRKEKISVWEEKIKKYKTTNVSCECESSKFRRWCNHQGYLVWRDEQIKLKLKTVTDNFFVDMYQSNGDAIFLLQKYGDPLINFLINHGEIIEDRKNIIFKRL